MDNIKIRTRSSESDTSTHDGDAQSRFGDRWPFPINGQVKVWTAKQRKQYKAQQLSEAEEALI